MRAVELMLVSEKPIWPLNQGYRIRGYQMAMALAKQGKRVVVSSMEPLPPTAPKALKRLYVKWPKAGPAQSKRFMAGWGGIGMLGRKRLARFQGLDPVRMAGVVGLAQRYRPGVVVGLGIHSPMLLRGLSQHRGMQRVWYAADELLRFQASCMQRESIGAWPGRLGKMALYGCLEAMFVRGLDGVVGVNPVDTWLLKWVAGAKRAVTIRNGVDLNYFCPDRVVDRRTQPRSLVFWGRMDFEPNIDAVTWFAHKVWPLLRWRRPDATWQIIGKNPHPRVQRLSKLPGVSVLGEVPDIRPHAKGASVTILPIRCGGGIKNKLLEAAAMGRPIVATPKAVQGLVIQSDQKPVIQCARPKQWVEAIQRLWCDASLAAAMSQQALAWVEAHHTWEGAANRLCAWLGSWSGSEPIDIGLEPATRSAQARSGEPDPHNYARLSHGDRLIKEAA